MAAVSRRIRGDYQSGPAPTADGEPGIQIAASARGRGYRVKSSPSQTIASVSTKIAP
jgi:hypothetical protein